MIGCVHCQHRSAQSMPEAQIAQAVQLLDLMLEHFAEDGHWTRNCYADGNGGHCLVGALLHLGQAESVLPHSARVRMRPEPRPRSQALDQSSPPGSGDRAWSPWITCRISAA